MSVKRVVVQGAYGDANIGDDLLLDMVVRLLKLKGFGSNNIIVAGNKAGYLRDKFKGMKVVSSTSGRYVNCDYLILGGGTQFFSFNKDSVKKSRLSIYFNVVKKDPVIVNHILRSRLGLNKKSKKIALGIGLGPFYKEIVEDSVKIKLSQFDEVLCRDYKSVHYCKKWGINSILSADLCLSDLFSQKYSYNHKLSVFPKKIIGIVIRDWIQNDKGELINQKIFDFVENCESYTVKLFLFSKKKDSELISYIKGVGFLKKENIHIWNPENDTFQKYLEIFSLCDLIITSRYHAAIFALNYRIPTICLAIDPKLKYITEEVDGFSYCEIDDIDKISNLIESVFSNYHEIQNNICVSYKVLNTRANRIFDLQIYS